METAVFFLKKIFRKIIPKRFTGSGDTDYAKWRKKYGVTAKELERQRKYRFPARITFSVVVPLYHTKETYLRELIASVMGQTYSGWELCMADASESAALLPVLEEYAAKDARIRFCRLSENGGISANTNAAVGMAKGDFIVFADHDDMLSPDALFECAAAVCAHPAAEAFYSDEDKVRSDGRKFFEPHFKSGPNIDLLCSMNYICHLFVVKRTLFYRLGGLRSAFDGAQDHDLALRVAESASQICHIPKILYHWRCHEQSVAARPESKQYAYEAGRRAVEEHYRRCGIPARVECGMFAGIYKTVYEWKEKPLISIIIPNKDHIADLKACMDSIDRTSVYRNYEFVIVENNSTEPETFAFYGEIGKRENVKLLFYSGSFNYSSIHNFAVRHTAGEYLLLLNNDTTLIAPDGLWELLGCCMRQDVGIVGARLYYPDDTVQHAGVVLGFGGIAGHTFIGAPRTANGYFSRIICTQDYSAVTAACMMTKKSVYQAVGGFTEAYRVAFGDVDFCMKVRELGLLVVYQPAAELYHFESKSRGLEDTPEKISRFQSEIAIFQKRWRKQLAEGDPYYNPNLTLEKSDFSLKM